MNHSQDDQREKIRRRAYELWEQNGRAGDPEDHWFRAERELTDRPRDPLEATVESIPPAEAVRSMEAAEPDANGVRPEPGEAAKRIRKSRAKSRS
jgi:hypothetical protein